MTQTLWVIRDRIVTWWFWHGPRGRVHELEGEVGRQREDMTLLIHAIADLARNLGLEPDSRYLTPSLRILRDNTFPPAS